MRGTWPPCCRSACTSRCWMSAVRAHAPSKPRGPCVSFRQRLWRRGHCGHQRSHSSLPGPRDIHRTWYAHCYHGACGRTLISHQTWVCRAAVWQRWPRHWRSVRGSRPSLSTVGAIFHPLPQMLMMHCSQLRVRLRHQGARAASAPVPPSDHHRNAG